MNISKEKFTKLAKEHLFALESEKNTIEIYGIDKFYEAMQQNGDNQCDCTPDETSTDVSGTFICDVCGVFNRMFN